MTDRRGGCDQGSAMLALGAVAGFGLVAGKLVVAVVWAALTSREAREFLGL